MTFTRHASPQRVPLDPESGHRESRNEGRKSPAETGGAEKVERGGPGPGGCEMENAPNELLDVASEISEQHRDSLLLGPLCR